MKILNIFMSNECLIPSYTIHDIGDIETLSEIYPSTVTQLNIPKIWGKTKGKGITVAILDSGTPYKHPDLKDNIDLSKCRTFIENEDIFDIYVGHGCISQDSLIYTTDGIDTIYNFCERRIGDNDILDISSEKIQTYSLNKSSGTCEIDDITHIHKTLINDDIIEVELTGNIKLKLTKWHPVFVQTPDGVEKKRADALSANDAMIIPYGINAGLLNSKEHLVEFGEYQECSSCGHVLGHIIPNTPLNKKRCKKCLKYASIVSKRYTTVLDESLAYILGVILTDGHVTSDRNKRVEIHSITCEILTKCRNILENFGIKSYIDTKQVGRCPRLIVNSKKFVELCIECGILVHNKTYKQNVPNIITKSPKCVIESFIAGVIDGDGCISPSNTKNRITSVSKEFIVNMYILLNSLGINSSYTKQEPKQYRNSFNNTVPVYNVVFTHVPESISDKLVHPEKFRRTHITGQKLKYPYTRYIKSVKSYKVCEYFYDLTVRNNNTYLADGVFVSNTHVSGTIGACANSIGIVGIAPEVTLVSIKVLNKNGRSENDSIQKGLEYCLTLNPDVINMSLGGTDPMPGVHEVIKKLVKRGIPVVCSAGNSGENKILYPAQYDESIAVGAYSDSTFKDRARFSAWGSTLDIMAPGEKIFSTYLNGQYSVMSGTSMAAPAVSGVIALMLSYLKKNNKSLSVEEIKNLLYGTCLDIGKNGRDDDHGWGIINPESIFSKMSGEPIKKKNIWQKFLSLFK